MRKTPIVLATGLAAAGVISASMTAFATGGGGPAATQNIVGSGSDTTETMMAYLDYGYEYDAGFGFNTPGGCKTQGTPQWLDLSCAGPQFTGADIDRTTAADGGTTAGSNIITSASAAFDCEGGVGCPSGNRDQGRGLSDSAGFFPTGTYINKVDSATQAETNNVASTTGAADTFTLGHIVTDNYTHDAPHGQFFIGSGGGIGQLCNQGTPGTATIDYARSSRVPGPGDCHGLHFVGYAGDGISWEGFNIAGSGIATMNNATAPCGGGICLTQQNLKDIYFNCTVTNWNQVGGANVTISRYTPPLSSGTRQTFDAFLGGSSQTCPGTTVIAENDNGSIPSADRIHAIFPFSIGVFTATPPDGPGATLGQIDGKAATQANVLNRTFPWPRQLFNVTCQSTPSTPAPACPVVASAETLAYVGEHGWICKNRNEHGYSTTGGNYRADIYNKIFVAGFAPNPVGAIGGGDPGIDFCRLTVS